MTTGWTGPDPLNEALDHGYKLIKAAGCDNLRREFPGWDIGWNSREGYRGRNDRNEIGPCTSYSAFRCMLALAEQRTAR